MSTEATQEEMNLTPVRQLPPAALESTQSTEDFDENGLEKS